MILLGYCVIVLLISVKIYLVKTFGISLRKPLIG